MYYALIMLSVAMLGGCFALNDVYRKKRSSNLLSSMESSCIGAVAGLIVLFIINGIKFEFTPFTLMMARPTTSTKQDALMKTVATAQLRRFR